MSNLVADNKYSKMQKEIYESISDGMSSGDTGGHVGHNSNPDYWNILLGDIVSNPDKWSNKRALDFGCGCGRNIINLIKLTNWEEVSGADISENNLINTRKVIDKMGDMTTKVQLFETNGTNVGSAPSDTYDFIMSTIVLQHICVWEIRYSILTDIYRILKKDGMLSLQMGYSINTCEYKKDYFENYYDADGTNSKCDCIVSDPDNQIIKDLKQIGFKDVSYQISKAWDDHHDNWIFVKAYK